MAVSPFFPSMDHELTVYVQFPVSPDFLGGLGEVTYLLCVLLIVFISTVMVVRVSITGFV